MVSERTYKIWRITNFGLILIGLIAPWVDISFEPYPAIVYGWEFFYWAISVFIFDIPVAIEDGQYGIAILEFFSSLSGILLMFYLFYNAYAVFNPSKRNKIISAMLIMFLAVVVFSATIGGREKILVGLYIFIVGVVSAAILEWQPQKNHPS